MRIKSKLLIIIAVILILTGLLMYLSINSNKQSKEIIDSGEETGIEILNIENDIVSFSVNSTSINYELNMSNGMWTAYNTKNVKLNQTIVNRVVSDAKYLYAESLVAENCADLSAFGLDVPNLIVSMKDTEDIISKINFGMQTATGTGYYTTINDEDDVYIVSSDIFDNFNTGLSQFRNRTILTVEGDVTEVMIVNETSNYTIRTKSTENVNTNNMTKWEMVTPYHMDVNQSIFEGKVINAFDFTISEFVDDNPSDYAKYGLYNPKYKIIIKTSLKEYKISLGNDKDGSLIYIKFNDEPNVYAIKKDMVKYRDYTPFYLLDSYVFIRKILSTDSIVFVADKTYKLKVGESDFYVNEKKVDETKFRNTYEDIISPQIAGEADASKIGKELCRFTFNYNTNTPSETVVYYEYGDMYAAASVNGSINFYVKRSYVDNMIESVKILAE